MIDRHQDRLAPGDLVPRPDPTKLTTDAVTAARKDIENLFNAKLATVEHKIEANAELFQELLKAAGEAVSKAEKASNDRFDSVNEFRQALSDQSATFLPRPEYGVAHKSLVDRVDSLASRLATMEASAQGKTAGMSSAGTLVMALVTGLAVLVSVASLAFNMFKHGG